MNLYDSIVYSALNGNGGGGGGGSSNCMVGEFTAQATEGAQEITIPYEGDGYIEFLAIVPADGYNSSATDVYNIARKNQTIEYALYKENPSVEPSYMGSMQKDVANFWVVRKNSDTNAQALTAGKSPSMTTQVYNDVAVTLNGDDVVKIRAKDKISVYVNDRSSYGFIASAKYKLIAVYH